MSVFDSLAGIPESITVGEVVTWVEDLPDFPIATHTVAYKFAGQTPQDGFQQFGINGTETGTYTYTFATPAAVKPGIYRWEKQVTLTAGSVMRVVDDGQITIMPSLSVVPTVTYAASRVIALEAATTNASGIISTSFNGQTVTFESRNAYSSELTFWRAQVIEEQRKINALSGRKRLTRIALEFTQ